MAVTPINLARVSFNLRAFNLRESMRLNQVSMYQVQNRLATGLRFFQPSEDPLRAASSAILDRRMERLDQVSTNLRSVNGTLTEVEVAMQETLDLLKEGHTLALQGIDDAATNPDGRRALAAIVESLIDQFVTVGNRRHLNTWLFSGHQTAAPFERRYEGVLYSGDANRMETIIDTDLTVDSFTVPGMGFFAAVSSEVRGVVDLDPALTTATRVSDLEGAVGLGVRLGRILVTAGDQQAQIDLSGAATVGDVLDRLNAELPDGLEARLENNGITLSQAGGRSVTVKDVGGGRAAVDLGLAGSFSGAARAGVDLNPRLTNLTRVADLLSGAGLDLAGGLVIRNGLQTATIQLDDAETVEDILNRVNEVDVGVWARITDDCRSLEILSRVSGVDMCIEENGGLAATALGLRSMHAGTTLAGLNDGRGVSTVPGSDFRIKTANGTTIDIDLDGAETLQDVLDRLNAGGGGAIVATLASQGNGLVITDQTAGAGTLTIEPLDHSSALSGLGLDVSATGNQLVGRDVNPIRVDSPFTALLELRAGLQGDDRLTMITAGERIERVMERMQQVQGQLASQARVMADRSERVETETTATRVLLSDVRDVDIADAAVRFQQLQMALQANLSTALQVMNLSLLDYLR